MGEADHGHRDHRHDHRHDGDARHFDDTAATWDDDPDKVRQSGEVAAAIAGRVPLRPRLRLLDYGAGTALVTTALLPHLPEVEVTVADSSSGMRQVLADKVAAGTLPSPTRVWDLDLETQPVPTERFDLVVTSNVLHHVGELDRVLAGFAELLDAGGWVAVADLDREDGSFHDHDFGGHHGFDRAEVASRLAAAGFVDVTVADAGHVHKQDRDYPVFLAVGRRA
ncbi:class I SAM-dependent DNA methyltransferase [Janibacter indicus]|uniref:class I SAM-dependent DNA methyltransferase n=1 Tax=Janibacter indicus TaxID=857417 RepID=UPI003D9A5C35